MEATRVSTGCRACFYPVIVRKSQSTGTTFGNMHDTIVPRSVVQSLQTRVRKRAVVEFKVRAGALRMVSEARGKGLILRRQIPLKTEHTHLSSGRVHEQNMKLCVLARAEQTPYYLNPWPRETATLTVTTMQQVCICSSSKAGMYTRFGRTLPIIGARLHHDSLLTTIRDTIHSVLARGHLT